LKNFLKSGRMKTVIQCGHGIEQHQHKPEDREA
jgi:hypothetical protein